MNYHFKNTEEILGMGGPWAGDFYFGEILIQEGVLDYYLVQNKKVFFVKCHTPTRWRIDVFFTINFFDSENDLLWEFDKKFKAVYLKKFINESDIEIYLAFHDKTEMVLILNINEEQLHCLGSINTKD